MRFLVVDANLAYGGMVKDFLETHMRDVQVDLAQNAAILRRRLRSNVYDFIIADILNSMDCEALVAELEACHVPILLWSFVNPGGFANITAKLKSRVMRKPERCDDIYSTVRSVIGSDPNLKAVAVASEP